MTNIIILMKSVFSIGSIIIVSCRLPDDDDYERSTVWSLPQEQVPHHTWF
jgi:hypothetical protein